MVFNKTTNDMVLYLEDFDYTITDIVYECTEEAGILKSFTEKYFDFIKQLDEERELCLKLYSRYSQNI